MSIKQHRCSRIGLGLVFALSISSASSQPGQAVAKRGLYAEFQRPPQTARPRVWWHWMNGNITKDGIRKALLWMHRSGIGGFQNFDAAFLTPKSLTSGWFT